MWDFGDSVYFWFKLSLNKVFSDEYWPKNIPFGSIAVKDPNVESNVGSIIICLPLPSTPSVDPVPKARKRLFIGETYINESDVLVNWIKGSVFVRYFLSVVILFNSKMLPNSYTLGVKLYPHESALPDLARKSVCPVFEEVIGILELNSKYFLLAPIGS